MVRLPVGSTHGTGTPGDRGRRGRRRENEVLAKRIALGSRPLRRPVRLETCVAVRTGWRLGVRQLSDGWGASIAIKQDVGKADQASRASGAAWIRHRMAYVPPHLLVNVAPTRGGFE